MTTILPNWIRPTKTPRYFAASHTANFDSYGFVPELTCSHVHRTYKKAAACATRMSWTWVVYKQLNCAASICSRGFRGCVFRTGVSE
jgi:hypothetical protein